MKIVKVPLNKVVGWKDNPKSIKKEDMDRLIWQIKHLGVYKPLLVTRALKKDKVDADWIALGGNQRLKGFNELGFKEVHVSVVKADNQKKRIEYSLSDNDRVASYELDLLKMQMEPCLDDFDLDMFKVDLGDMMGMDDLMVEVEIIPGAGEKELDENIETTTTCPSCGYEW